MRITDWILLIKNPKLFYASALKYKSILKIAFVVLILIGIMTYIFSLVHSNPNVAYLHKLKRYKKLIFIFPYLAIFFFLVSIIFIIAIKSLWYKLCLRLLNKKVMFSTLFSFLAISLIPLLIQNTLALMWPNVKYIFCAGKYGMPYSKMSLAQFFINYSSNHPIIFYFINRINLFDLWIAFLQIIALSVIGRIDYWKSFLILLSFEMAYSIPVIIIKGLW